MRSTSLFLSLLVTLLEPTSLAYATLQPAPTNASANLPHGRLARGWTQLFRLRRNSSAPQPSLVRRDTQVEYGMVKGHLFHGGIKGTDVDQGSLGDCWLAASLSAIAHAQSAVIKSSFRANPDGSFAVRLYSKADGQLVPEWHHVTRELPLRGEAPAYMRGHNTRHPELWPSLLEKAFAARAGGYGALNRANWAAPTFETLTGQPATTWTHRTRYTEDAYTWIRKAILGHKAVVALTYAFGYKGIGLLGKHYYVVLGATEKAGHKYIVLRNPWGYHSPGADGMSIRQAGDGIFKLPLSEFVRLFRETTVGGV